MAAALIGAFAHGDETLKASWGLGKLVSKGGQGPFVVGAIEMTFPRQFGGARGRRTLGPLPLGESGLDGVRVAR